MLFAILCDFEGKCAIPVNGNFAAETGSVTHVMQPLTPEIGSLLDHYFETVALSLLPVCFLGLHNGQINDTARLMFQKVLFFSATVISLPKFMAKF